MAQETILSSPKQMLGEMSAENLQAYFQYVHQLEKNGYSFPVNLDDVWPICYPRKDHAVRELKANYYEDIDYIVVKGGETLQSADFHLFPKNGENADNFPQKSGKIENEAFSDDNEGNACSGRKSVTYYLSLSGFEHLVVRRRREVFEVYRQVTHAHYNNFAEQQARAQAEAIREAPVETRPDGRRIFLDYRLFSHRFYLMTSTADYEMESYCKELIGRLQEGWQMPVDANEVYSMLGFSSAVNLTTFMKGGNARTISAESPYKYEEDYICTKVNEQNQSRTFRLITIGALGRLLKMMDASPRFQSIYHRYFPEDNMRQDEILKLYPVGLTISQHSSDPEERINEALHNMQLLEDKENRHVFGSGCKPSQVTERMVREAFPSAMPDELRSVPCTPHTAAAPLPSADSSFLHLFGTIMSMRGKVSDQQIVECMYDLRRLAGV